MLPPGGPAQGFEGATIAQAVLFDTGVQFPTEGVSCYEYDYSAGVLHVAVGNSVRTYSLGGSTEGSGASVGGSSPEPLVTDVGEGPPIAALQASPDGRLLCLQRSPGQLQFVDRSSGNMFIQVSFFYLLPIKSNLLVANLKVQHSANYDLLVPILFPEANPCVSV